MDSPALSQLRLHGRTVDLQRGCITDESGHTVTLRPQAAEVLKLLAARPGTLVGKDELMRGVWGDIAVTDDSLVQCIKEVRKALCDENHKTVKTILKRGYVFELPPEPTRRRHWRGWAGLAAAGAVALAVLAGVVIWPMAKSAAEPPTIAVLPFENINGDEKWDRFATGVTEDIITDLARFRDIPVIARTSTEVYRDGAHDVREIGKALGVKYLLEGSLQVDGHRMRVTAQLIDADTGMHIWSERYDRPAADLLEVQDEITEKIAVTLTGWQGQVTEAERALVRRKNATDLNAYDYWLLGIEAKHRMTMEGLVEARAYFEKGLRLAPDFMPLVRDMGISYTLDMEIGSVIDYPAWVEAQRNYAEKAVALDPNDPTANSQMGVALSFAGDEERANQYRERALQLGPNNADNLMCLAWGYAGWETERAIELVERTLKLNPRHPSWWNFPIAQAYFAARRFDAAYAAAKQIGESPSQAAFVAMSAAQLGRTHEAAEAAARVLRMKPDWTAESMFPYQSFRDETVLLEGAAKAGLPICMTAAQIEAYSGDSRFKQCEEERARVAVN
jgi:TolB-like protein/DNA-binding winged helix-turn-helix (wHTH) protein